MTTTEIKFTNLEVEIITDRPEECIVECSCQFYEDSYIKQYGDSNKTDKIIYEKSYEKDGKVNFRAVWPEDLVWDSCHKV